MARTIVSRHFDFLPDTAEEAVSEALLAGWTAAQRWQPGRASFSGWVAHAMYNGVVDWVRRRLGRSGERAAIIGAVSLDEHVAQNAHGRGAEGKLDRYFFLPDDRTRPQLEAAEVKADLKRWIRRAHLTAREREWLAAFLADLPQRTLTDRWGVDQAIGTHVKRAALTKLRGAAR